MKFNFPSRFLATIAGAIVLTQAVNGQVNSTQLFGPVYARKSSPLAGYSPDNASFPGNPYTFSSQMVSLTCGPTPTASLSGPLMLGDGSGPAGTVVNGVVVLQPGGNLLVDNTLLVTVTPSGKSAGPTQNVCTGGADDGYWGATSPNPPNLTNNCFVPNYRTYLTPILGLNPDTAQINVGTVQNPILETPDYIGGVPAYVGVVPQITFDSQLVPNTQENVVIDLSDEGGDVVSSSIFLTTNCTINGVSGGSFSGNPINGSQDSGTQQAFTFNSDTVGKKGVQFGYDVTGALLDNDLGKNKDGSIPQVFDSPVDPSAFQSVYVPKTPFATSNCLVHNGEVLADGVTQACKLYTLDCLNPVDNTLQGANCPVSSKSNEKVQDNFDGPTFSLFPIVNSAGKLITHEGIGFLMASENWAPPGGQCTFEQASGLSAVPCPQNLLTDFSGPGGFQGTGLTANPNSTFISIYGVPQPLTAVDLQGAKGGNWVNTSSPQISFSSTPPNFTKGAYTSVNGVLVPLPNVAQFVPAPIKSITYGISLYPSVPSPITEPALNDPITGTDITIANGTSPTTFSAPTEPSFKPSPQTLASVPDGQYLVHYYATDCSGTQELLFYTSGVVNNEPVWHTSFYTLPVNVDTTFPTLTFVPQNPSYKVGTTQTVTYYCTDATSGSGVTHCGSNAFPLGTFDTRPVGTLSFKINANKVGSYSIAFTAVDGAGNTTTQNFNYTVHN